MSIYKKDLSNDVFWAATGMRDFLPKLCQKREDYFKRLDEDGMLTLFQAVYDRQYSTSEDDSNSGKKISFAGPNNELVIARAGIMRTLRTHLLNSIISQMPEAIPVASNDDFSTKAQIHSCKSVLAHFRRELNTPRVLRNVVDYYLLYGFGYLVQYWDQEEKKMKLTAASPRRVIVDLEPYRDLDWAIYVERANKYDVAKKYNVSEDDFGELQNIDTLTNGPTVTSGYYFDNDSYDNDYIDVYHFFHNPTSAMPDGRYTIFVNDHVSFTEHLSEKLPFKRIPIRRYMPEEIAESPYGYSPLFDLLGPQDFYNATLSTIFTQQNRMKSIISLPVGSSNPLPVEGDANLMQVQYPIDQPNHGVSVINTYNVPDGLYKILELEKTLMREIVGTNSTAMGESEAKSGSHAALLYSASQQFHSEPIAAFVRLIEEQASDQLELIKNFLDDEIFLKISGEDKFVYLKVFKKGDISGISGAFCQAVSPMLSTPSGRLSIADNIMKIPGIAFTAKDYLKLIDTGQLDASFTTPRDLDMVLSAERAALSMDKQYTIAAHKLERFDKSGIDDLFVVEEIRALITDDHMAHLRDHAAGLSSPQIRMDSRLVELYHTHMGEHIWLSKWGNRDMLLASGQKPMPDLNTPKPSATPGENGGLSRLADPRNPNPGQLPKSPNMPVNPINGQRIEPEQKQQDM